MKTTGIAIILVGCLYAGFWLIALHEWNCGSQIPRYQTSKTQFEEQFPVLKIVFRWYDFAPFEKHYEDRCRPGADVLYGIVRHSITGIILVIIGAVTLTIALVRNNRKFNRDRENHR